jgi:hypothetical protein
MGNATSDTSSGGTDATAAAAAPNRRRQLQSTANAIRAEALRTVGVASPGELSNFLNSLCQSNSVAFVYGEQVYPCETT